MAEYGEGLLFAYVLDGAGGGREIDWDGIGRWRPEDGPVWVHFDRTGDAAANWLSDQDWIDPAAAETLLSQEGQRPRVERFGDALMIVLRGINLNPGADPEDLVAIHMWVEKDRIVTLRRRRLRAGLRMRDAIVAGDGPSGEADFISMLLDFLFQPMHQVLHDLDDQVGDLNARVLAEADPHAHRRTLQELRHMLIALRRHLAPQRDALGRLHRETVSWIDADDRTYLREDAESMVRFVDDLDAVAARAQVVQEELQAQLTERTNKTVYILTVISALLLPAALLTGLFGVNVGGMPWVKSDLGFWIILLGVPALAVVELLLLKFFKLL